MVLTTAIDITSRKIAEEALAARVVDLARSNSQLQKFAYVASHDLQEPLRTITNFTDMLAKDIGIENLSEKSRMFMDFICSGSQRMKTLILDLLKYSRAEMKPTEIKKVNLSDSVDIAVANLSAAIEECSGEIKYEKLGSVHAVPTQMTQIFQNLIGNSLKYRGDDPPVIQISSQKKGKFIKISIADNGIGFDEKHKERIFEVFQRLFTMSEYSGTGIGLAICQRIVHNHGGDIWAEGIPETGSTFHFTIPRNAEKGR